MRIIVYFTIISPPTCALARTLPEVSVPEAESERQASGGGDGGATGLRRGEAGGADGADGGCVQFAEAARRHYIYVADRTVAVNAYLQNDIPLLATLARTVLWVPCQ